MTYLNFAALEAISAQSFQEAKPYPWMNPADLLTEAGYQGLVETLPNVSMFHKRFGVKRAHGQQSHDRYTLEYRPGLPLSPHWDQFLTELQGKPYSNFLKRLFGVKSLELNFHWHYTPNGCSVSPHCDAKHKLGSHIFYFNTKRYWDPAWGGERPLFWTIKGNLAEKALPDLKISHNRWLQQPLGISVCYFNYWINPGMGPSRSMPGRAHAKGVHCRHQSAIAGSTESSGSLEKS